MMRFIGLMRRLPRRPGPCRGISGRTLGRTLRRGWSTVYYWDSLEALQGLMEHPAHLQAKAAQSQWLDGYQVVIAEVLRVYGDARLDHLLASSGGGQS